MMGEVVFEKLKIIILSLSFLEVMTIIFWISLIYLNFSSKPFLHKKSSGKWFLIISVFFSLSIWFRDFFFITIVAVLYLVIGSDKEHGNTKFFTKDMTIGITAGLLSGIVVSFITITFLSNPDSYTFYYYVIFILMIIEFYKIKKK